MTWWYENEEEEMKLYKNEDLCIECKNEFFSKPYDHRDPTPGQLGYCIKCDNYLIKEKKMEFDKTRVFTAVNADELRAGDKVIVANTMANLREDVRKGINIDMLREVHGEDCLSRFIVKEGWFPLAYLVERKENCTNCGKTECSAHSEHDDFKVAVCSNWIPKAEPKTEQKAEKHYRPFKDTDELIKVWGEKIKAFCDEIPPIVKPLIWVKDKESGDIELISMFGRGEVFAREYTDLNDLFDDYTFLDSSPCGVEE